MARVTVTIPTSLRNLPQQVDAAVERGLNAGTQQGASLVQQAATTPVDRGHLRASLAPRRAVRTAGGFESGIGTSGDPRVQISALVQEFGRRRGARRPPTAPIQQWVGRKLKEQVATLANRLRAEYESKHRTRRRSGRPSMEKWRKRATYILTRAIVKKMHERGMAGKRYVRRHKDRITDLLVRSIVLEIDHLARTAGGGL